MSMRILLLAAFLCSVPAPLPAQTHVTLRIVDWADLEEMQFDQEALAAFRSANPGIEVIYEPNPSREYEEKILTGMAGGDPPDVFLLDSKLIPTFTNKHVLLDLDPFVAAEHIDTAQWFSSVSAIARKGSHLYAFPKGFSPLMVFYNRKLFREAGIEPPAAEWTWDDFLSIARKLTVDTDHDGKPDQWGTAFSNYYYSWIPWVWSAGGDVVDPSGTRADTYLNSPATEKALRFLIDLRNTYHVAPDVGTWVQAEKTGTNFALFASGKIAMIVDGHWRVPKFMKYLREGSLDIGVAPFPQTPGGTKVNVMYESGWCVPVNAPHPAESSRLAAFMAGEFACRIRAKGRLEIPANRIVAAENVLSDTTGIEKTFTGEIPFCRQPWGSVIERFSEIEWTLQDAVDEVMLNGKPMHETMSRYAARVNRQLSNIHEHEQSRFAPIRSQGEILAFLLGAGCAVLVACTVLYLFTGKKERRGLGHAFGFLTPSLIYLTVFIFTPIVFAAYLSFHSWDIVIRDKPFIGLGNFSEIFRDPGFWNALANTCVFSLNVPVSLAFALAVALLLERRLRGIGFIRALYFLPGVTSIVATALVWMWIYHPTFGAANFLLRLVGLPPAGWLNSENTAMVSVMIFTIWLGIGYQIVIFLAGLQGIPGEIYEASRVDGASGWRRFWYITLPLLKPTTFFILVTSFISSFQVFTTIYVMTAGGPVRSTDVLVYHIYQAAWEQLRMGYAAAMSWVLFVIVMIATWIQFKFIGRNVDYG